jgi:hypothetical protein
MVELYMQAISPDPFYLPVLLGKKNGLPKIRFTSDDNAPFQNDYDYADKNGIISKP